MGNLIYWDDRRIEEHNIELKKVELDNTITDEDIKRFEEKMESSGNPIVIGEAELNKLNKNTYGGG